MSSFNSHGQNAKEYNCFVFYKVQLRIYSARMQLLKMMMMMKLVFFQLILALCVIYGPSRKKYLREKQRRLNNKYLKEKNTN